LKKYAPWSPDPFFRDGVSAGKEVAGIGILRVNERLSASTEEKNARVDILARLMEGKDEFGQPLGRDELTGEAMTQLVAGSDTTSNTLGP
jgi:benzoate 4-monooxygenase